MGMTDGEQPQEDLKGWVPYINGWVNRFPAFALGAVGCGFLGRYMESSMGRHLFSDALMVMGVGFTAYWLVVGAIGFKRKKLPKAT